MSRFNLRQRPRISYYEPEEPSFDEYIFCEQCADFVYEYCSIHGPLLVIPDDKVAENPNVPSCVPRAALTIPKVFLHLAPSIIPGAGLGVFTTLTLPRDVRFGPYKGAKTSGINSMYCWQIYDNDNKPSYVIDGADPNKSNWMRYVNCSRHSHEQNLVAFQYQGQLYYRTIKIIPRFTELMIFYGSEFANSLQVDLRRYNAPSEYLRLFGARILNKPKLGSQGEKNNKNEKLCNNPNEDIADIPIVDILNRNSLQVNDQNNNQQDTPKERFICNECDKEFDTRDLIIIHLKTKHTKDIYFRCNKCAYFTVTKEALDKHSKLHDETRRYACETCNYRFKDCTTLKRHENTCYRNSNVADTRTGKRYQCSECGKPFSNKRYLVKHKRIHSGEKPYACSECEKQFSQRNRLVRHKRIHTGEKPYSCSECGKQFSQRNHLVRHIRMHTGEKPYSCSECGKQCSQRRTLVRHLKIHTGEKPYACSECGKPFITQSSLVRHIKIHTGEKPYACEECKRSFIEKSTLNEHMRIHTGEKPYSCLKCHQLFRRRRNMNRHVKTVHKAENVDQSQTSD